MTKKYFVVSLALIVLAGTALSAEAFSFRGVLERFRLVKTNPNASSTATWVRGIGRNSTSTMPIFGTISSVSDTSFVVKLDLPNSMPGARGSKLASSSLPSTLTINLNADTVYTNGSKADLITGIKINGQAKINDDKSLTAVRLHLNPPRDGSNRPSTTPNRSNRGQGNGLNRGPQR